MTTNDYPPQLALQQLIQGFKERTDAEYGALLSAAGFELARLIPVLSPFYVIEAVCV